MTNELNCKILCSVTGVLIHVHVIVVLHSKYSPASQTLNNCCISASLPVLIMHHRPVTSFKCERSASKLRRLHAYMHVSMAQERLTSLALLHIHYEKDINLEEVVYIFTKIAPKENGT